MWPTFYIPDSAQSWPLGAGYIGKVGPVCSATSVTITPATDIPAASAGDCIFFVAYTQNNTASTDADAWIEITGSVTPIAVGGVGIPIAEAFCPDVYYKFLTESDLTDGFTFTVDGYSVSQVCALAFVVRGVHTECPVMTPSVWWPEVRANMTILGPLEAVADFPVFQLIGWTDTGTPTNAGTPFDLGTVYGPNETLLIEEELGMTGGGASDPCKQYWFGLWNATLDQDENWLPGEENGNTLDTADGWVLSGATRTVTGGELQTKIQSDGAGSTQHYIGYDVTLVAGQKYTFAVQFNSPFTYNSSIAVTIYDPSAIQSGMVMHKPDRNFRPPGTVTGSFWVDTNSDRGTAWKGGYYTPDIDGDPNTAGGWAWIHFTARENGTHNLRVGVGNGTANIAFTAAANYDELVEVSSVMFRRDYVNPMRVFTPSGAVTDGTGNAMKRVATYGCDTFSDNNSFSYGFAVVPADATFPPMRIAYGADTDIDGVEQLAVDPLRAAYSGSYGGNHGVQHYLSRPLYPVANAVTGKYYLECKIRSATAGRDFFIGVSPMWYMTQNSDPRSSSTFRYVYSYVPAVNDVIGVTVDFSAKEVKFYVNNVLAVTRTMTDTWQATGNVSATMPHLVGAYFDSYQPGTFEWHVKDGTFTYSVPSGFIEADYLS